MKTIYVSLASCALLALVVGCGDSAAQADDPSCTADSAAEHCEPTPSENNGGGGENNGGGGENNGDGGENNGGGDDIGGDDNNGGENNSNNNGGGENNGDGGDNNGVEPPGDEVCGGGVAELPRVWVDTEWVEPTGQVHVVGAGGDLQAAIDGAERGDVIELEAGATYVGNFTLPAKPGEGWVTIRSSGALPAPGTRVTPAQAGQLAKLVSERVDRRVVQALSGASHYRLVGLEVTYAPEVTRANAVIEMQNGSSHIIVDRSYVHGHDALDLQRCVMMHAEHAAVIDSWLSQCHYKGQDSQAIVAWNTNGPLKIVNNHLEGAGENIMFGGATPGADTLPADIEIRRNHFYKPDAWKLEDGSTRWTVKNLFEIKFATRVLLQGNLFDGNWADGQDGHAFNIKLAEAGSGNQVSDITLCYNTLRRTELGLKISGPTTRMSVAHNLLLVDGARLFTLLGSTRDLHLLHNTGRHTGNIITSSGGHQGFVARGNIWGSSGGYGIKGGGAEGTSTLDADFAGWVYVDNGHIGRAEARYPEGNRFVADEAEVGFEADWSVPVGSPFEGLGADIAGLTGVMAGVE